MPSEKLLRRFSAIAKWLANECRAFDSWLLVIAVLNWSYISFLPRDCRGIAPADWHCWSQEWYAVWNRLLIAALCVRTRRSWLGFIGLLISLQIVAGHLFYFFNSDEIWQKFGDAREFGDGVWRAVIEHELTQGVIAVLCCNTEILYRRLSINQRIRPIRFTSLSINRLRGSQPHSSAPNWSFSYKVPIRLA
jgi:hypothetical protein